MKLSSILIGVIIISMLGLGCLSWLSGLEAGYSDTVAFSNLTDSKLQERLEYQQNLSSDLNNTIKSLEFTSGGVGFFSLVYDMIRLGWQAIMMILGSIGNFIGMITDALGELSSIFGLPSWLIPSIIAIIIIIIMVMILEMFIKWKLES